MEYLKRLFSKLIILRIFLLAVSVVFLAIFLVTGWFKNLGKLWVALFGFAITPLHALVWAILALVAILSVGSIKKLGERYGRTPRADELLFPDKIFWFIGFAVLVLSLYAFLKNSWGNWITNLSLYYSAIVLPVGYLIVCVLLPFIVGYALVKRKTVIDTSDKKMESLLRICSDNPIQTSKEDRLGRGKFVDRIYKVIDNYKGSESLVIGMNGAWGEGKTSVHNLLKEKVKEEACELIIVEFNPWYFRDEDILIREFFKAIALELGNSYLIPSFNKYVKAVTELLQSTTATAGPISINFGLRTKGKVEEINELKERLKESLKKIDKKVLIMIDDIDRLTPQELLLTLKLVRLCADFHRFIYVLSFDRKATCDSLEKAGLTSAFLEKIVQIELQLPQTEKRKIDGFFGEGLDEVFKAFGISLSEKELERLRSLYGDHITHKIQNLRDAKRLIAALICCLGEIKGEVNIVDAISLEALRIFASPVWEDISRSREFYVFHWGVEFAILGLLLPFDENKRIKYRREHLEKVLECVHEDSIRFAKDLVVDLFPEAGDALEARKSSYDNLAADYEREQRVAHPDYLKKYMQLQVPLGIISDKQIMAVVEEMNKSSDTEWSKKRLLDAFAAYQRDDLLYDFIQKLALFAPKLNETGDTTVLEAIFQYSDRFSLTDRGLIGSEMERARALLYAIVNKYGGSPKIQERLLDMVRMSKSMLFVESVIFWCTPDHNRIIGNFENIDLARLKQAYKERFKKEYVDQNKDIFLTDHNHVRYLLYSVGDAVLITSYMLTLFAKKRSYIGRLLLRYASNRHGTGREHWVFQYEDLKKEFEVEKLYEFVKAHQDKAYENDNEKWAVEQFLKNHEKIANKQSIPEDSNPQ
jgi:predicted KAP-like P-loop ATPase